MARTGIATVGLGGLAGLALAAGLGGCATGAASSSASSSVPPDDIPPCDEIFVEGETVGPEFATSCVDETGELVTTLPVTVDCQDDRTLMWNDLAWGYEDGPMTLIPEEDVVKIPEEELDQCLSADSAGTPTTTAG